MVITSPKFTFLKNKDFDFIMLLSGILFFLALVLYQKEYFVNFVHRESVDYSQIDVDYPFGNTLVIWLSFLSFAVGLALWARSIPCTNSWSYIPLDPSLTSGEPLEWMQKRKLSLSMP